MAAKKDTAAAIVEEVKESTPVVTDPFSVKVKIRLPKSNNGEANFQIVGVNGKMFKVQRGIEVEVPAPVAAVLEDSARAQEDADAFIERITSK